MKANAESPYKQTEVQLKVTLAPIWTGNLVVGIQELLNSLVLKFIPALDGLLLIWDDLSIDANACAIVDPASAHLSFSIIFSALLFSPQERQRRDKVAERAENGSLNRLDDAELSKGSIFVMNVLVQGPDQIGGLVEGLFNASVGSQGLPRGEDGQLLVEFVQVKSKDMDNDASSNDSTGLWVWKSDGTALVGHDAKMRFEVLNHDSIALEGQYC